MKATTLIKYIHDPSLLDKDSVGELKKLAEDFPYFQTAYLLLSMASRKWDASVYQQSLKKSAIVSTNRAHLFRLIHQVEQAESRIKEVTEPLLQDQKEEAKQELEILKAAEIASEQVVKTAAETIAEKEKEDIRSVPDAEQILEQEIGKEVVKSFVETELLKTHEVNRQEKKEESPESFADWLSFLKKNNGQPYEEIRQKVNESRLRTKEEQGNPEIKEPPKKEKDTTEEERKQKNKAIIDKIIESSPGIIRAKEDQRFYAPDLKAKESLLENEHLVTETLAKIYALQGSVNKAIRAYEILGLRFPQKRAYYDSQIQKLKSSA